MLREKPPPSRCSVIIYRSFRYVDENVLKEDVNAIHWDDLCTNEESVELMWHNFRYKFKEIVIDTLLMLL